jgi:hypothetical protein
MRGGLIGVIAGVAWLALMLEVDALASPSADANPFSAWLAGAVFGLFLVSPITGTAGVLCGLITAGLDGRRALRACAIGAMIFAALIMAWAGITREERWHVFGKPVWHFPGREPTVMSAMLFTAQHSLPIPAGAGAVAGAVMARLRRNARQ